MAPIFDFTSYKQFVLTWIESHPNRGHGKLKQMADAIRVSPVVMTQVFRGNRELTPEQAAGVAKFAGLTESETNFFLLLVHRARSGSPELNALLDKQLKKARASSQQLKNRIEQDGLNEEAQALFYSSWLYSAVRFGLAIPGTTPAHLAKAWDIDLARIHGVLEFLLQHGLLRSQSRGYALGPSVLHIGHDHPLVERHHGNWRQRAERALQRPAARRAEDLYYTGPMVISAKLAEDLRKELVRFIEKAVPRIRDAENERLYCLNLDWFRLL